VRSSVVVVAVLVTLTTTACSRDDATALSTVATTTHSPASTVAVVTSTIAPTTTATTTTTLPVMHHEPTGWDDWPDCPAELSPSVPGERLTVPWFDDRPTMLQRSADPNDPLIVVFHGQNGCIEKVQGQTDLEQIATAWGVNVLWLSGKPVPTRSWNTNGHCCTPASSEHVDDIPYVEAAIAMARASGLHPSRVLAIGKSNGAGMAVSVGCRRPDLFDVVVAIAGWASVSCDRAELSLMVEIGTEDEVFEVSQSQAIVDMWRSRVATCLDPPTEEVRERATITTWRCGDQFIRFTVIDGMGHLWPTYPWFNADEEILHIARGELPSP